ncbi:MAG: BMP family ABC transporter substrate-binding protein [Treponematales bacterium]
MTKGIVAGLALGALLAAAGFAGCEKKSAGAGSAASIAVFIPGAASGSPIYEMLIEGVRRAVAEWNAGGGAAEASVIEGGFNQAAWESKVTALAASGGYGLIVSSNPSLPAIVRAVSARFPAQRFLLLDGELAGNPAVYSLSYNQREQSYMAGHIAALAALELAQGGASPRWKLRAGLVAAQEYPAMNGVILPGFLEGAQAADGRFAVDFRVVGNWYDAARAAEIAAALFRDGVPAVLCVAGGANEGVVQAAQEAGGRVVWFDTAGYAVRPGVVVGSAILRQDRAAYEKTLLYLSGALPFGSAETAGIASGYVDFADDDPLYLSTVSEAVRTKQAALLAKLRSGELRLDTGSGK